MENREIGKYTAGFGISFLISSIFTALLVIIKELYTVTDTAGKHIQPIKDWMKSLFGHHWTTHGVFTIGLFVVLGLILSRMNMEKFDAKKTTWVVVLGVVIGGLLLKGFYLYELVK